MIACHVKWNHMIKPLYIENNDQWDLIVTWHRVALSRANQGSLNNMNLQMKRLEWMPCPFWKPCWNITTSSYIVYIYHTKLKRALFKWPAHPDDVGIFLLVISAKVSLLVLCHLNLIVCLKINVINLNVKLKKNQPHTHPLKKTQQNNVIVWNWNKNFH